MKFLGSCFKSCFSAAVCCCCCFLLLLIAFFSLNDGVTRTSDFDDETSSVVAENESPLRPEASQENVLNAKRYVPPVQFEENRSSSGELVGYVAKNNAQTFYMTKDGIVVVFPEGEAVSKTEKQISMPPNAIKLSFVGAQTTGTLRGDDLLECKSHYFCGNDPKKWQRNIPNFKKVIYEGVYPGIDAVFYGNGSQIEYDLYIAPKANPSNIQLVFEGADKVMLDDEGNLHLILPDKNELWMEKPVLYQGVGDNKVFVEGAFHLSPGKSGETILSFEIHSYDKSQLLVIDPVLVFSTYLGGSDKSHGNAIGVDEEGNVYVTGDISASDFPITPNAFQRSLTSTSVYVTKFNKEGSALLYSTYMGGTNGDKSSAIAISNDGAAFVTGFTSSADFPVTQGAFMTKSPIRDGNSTAFVAKVSPDGSTLSYASFLGGSDSDTGSGIAVDAQGNAYVVGTTYSTNFPVTPGAYQMTNRSPDGGNAFVSKVNSVGSSLIYSTYFGGSGSIADDMVIGDVGEAIAIDNEGAVYITGTTYSQDFPITHGAFQEKNGADVGKSNAYIAKLSSSGNSLVYSTYLGGDAIFSGNEKGDGIAVDAEGNACVVGKTCSSNFPVTEKAFQKTRSPLNKGETGFVSKLDRKGEHLLYSSYFGGSGISGVKEGVHMGDVCVCVALDKEGRISLAGYTFSSDFPVTATAIEKVAPKAQKDEKVKSNGFLSLFNKDGSSLIYSTYIGGTSNGKDSVEGIAVSHSGKIYITGETDSMQFPTTEGAFQKRVSGKPSSNSFVMEFEL